MVGDKYKVWIKKCEIKGKHVCQTEHVIQPKDDMFRDIDSCIFVMWDMYDTVSYKDTFGGGILIYELYKDNDMRSMC